MHDAVTNSSAATTEYQDLDDSLTPISYHSHRLSLSFTRTQVSPFDVSSPAENWHLSTPTEPFTARTNSIRTSAPNTLENPSFPMSTLSDNTPSDPRYRWRFNMSGQLVDSDSTGWGLADEIVRLKIGDVPGEGDDDRAEIRTPPKSKMPTAAVAQLSEASPLESSSNTSAGSSPHASEHQIGISHSRGSSTDTTLSSSRDSAASATGNTLLVQPPPLKINTMTDVVKERPHSFSGGLSTSDLRRLQHAGEPLDAADRSSQQPSWAQNHYNNPGANADQLSYPSLANHIHRPQPQLHPQLYDYRNGTSQIPINREDPPIEYASHQRNFNSVAHGLPLQSAVGPAYVAPRPTYRQPPRNFPQQGIIPSPTTMGYPPGHHASHLSLGNSQQLYDMMLPGGLAEGHLPTVPRVQQQPGAYRANHHHSASDPSTIRDTAPLTLMNGNMQPPFGPGNLYQPSIPALPVYPSQYYGAQEQYAVPDAAVVAARLQAQYTGPYGVSLLPPQSLMETTGISSPPSSAGQGPSANNRKLGLYKTELCRSWEEKGSCRYGAKCQFAHGEEELRKVARHPKYKTEICRTFWVSGSCPYGKRCCFIHTELPPSGGSTATGTGSTPDNSSTQQRPDGRARSMSTNSDPNDTGVSLLARISAKRVQEPSISTPVDVNSSNTFALSRPPTGSLRVDTKSAFDANVIKQNKSAYPTFTSNGILLPAPEHISSKSPGPVTAGPDLGRHNNSIRREIVGLNPHINSASPNVRHSFNGSDVELSFSSSPPASGHSSMTMASTESTGRVNGHVRSGSAGNWASFSRNAHLGQAQGSNAAGDIMANLPWSSTELGVGSSRLNDKVWA